MLGLGVRVSVRDQAYSPLNDEVGVNHEHFPRVRHQGHGHARPVVGDSPTQNHQPPIQSEARDQTPYGVGGFLVWVLEISGHELGGHQTWLG